MVDLKDSKPGMVNLQLTEKQFYDIINILGMVAANVSFFAIQDIKRQGDPQALVLAEERKAATEQANKASAAKAKKSKAKALVKAKKAR